MADVTLQITMSLDGYVAGPGQSLEDPLGRGGRELHDWLVATRFFHAMTGREGGDEGVAHEQVARWFRNVGAFVMGRNMFGPVRGPWPDASWTGWWGPNPPYHAPVFVLTHHPRPQLVMEGGTTFHFVTDGIEAALDRAREAAGAADVAIAGGAQVAQHYLAAGLVDRFAVHVAPLLLGGGARLFDGLDGGPDGYRCVELVASDGAAHFTYERPAE